MKRVAATTKGDHTTGSNESVTEHTFEATAVHTNVHKAALHTKDLDNAGNPVVGDIMINAAVFNADETLQIGSQLTVKWTIQLGS